ncbi:hypothetical protein KKE19_02705 [Patescibacteria group bacterium]|nr:hypothetical protein [Patescibacteria group bacterium]MBU4367747.1 hypothetical protein [Patescibacteria group bacterium]MBU4461803.1 hypothetical protein [Patescibacteria group bacterium]MCG2700066.1 hypothetical protein [Candidatus Parcubacteria bacterium]
MKRNKMTRRRKEESVASLQNRLKQTAMTASKKGGFNTNQQIIHNQVEQMLYDIGRTVDVKPRRGFKKELWQEILAKLDQLEKEVGVKKES